MGLIHVKLPIEIAPNTNPKRFRWQQRVDTINGTRTVDYEEVLRPALAGALVELLNIANGFEMVKHSLLGEIAEAKKGVAEARDEANKLQAFKDWVHGYLDAHGVPKEFPNGPHTKEGCRVGDRMEFLLKELEGAKRQCDELTKQLANKQKSKV